MKQQQRKRLPNSEPAPLEAEGIAAMIERVAQEHRLKLAIVRDPAAPPPAAKPVREAPTSPTPASPELPASSIDAGHGSDVHRVRCARGHLFATLAEHPRIDGTDACPHCMLNTIHAYRKMFTAMVRPTKFE